MSIPKGSRTCSYPHYARRKGCDCQSRMEKALKSILRKVSFLFVQWKAVRKKYILDFTARKEVLKSNRILIGAIGNNLPVSHLSKLTPIC